ncbi:MAG: zinc ribbon domain-containing protein [Proteobacteria bacterium]|nr:zinc ribbon domain-containing protein [Pseudomonadota bacterium]
MPACPRCKADTTAEARFCSACGAHLAVPGEHGVQHAISALFAHIPHPHIHHRRKNAPLAAAQVVRQQSPPGHWTSRVNNYLAVKITNAVGTMWCAYVFAAIALISLPDAIRGGAPTLVAWIAQTFLQLVLLSIIIVGQKVASEAGDQRAIDTYNDAEAVLHEAVQIQHHLAAQDAVLQRLVDKLGERRGNGFGYDDTDQDRPA